MTWRNADPGITLLPAGAHDSSRKQFLRFTVGAAGITLLLFTYYVLTWGGFPRFRIAIDTCSEPFCDFASFYYPMGAAIFHTALPVQGFVYSPFIAILLAVFRPLGLETSIVLWGILQVACVIVCVLLFRWLVPANLPIQLLFVAVLLSSFTLLHNLDWGQVGVFTLAALLGLLVLYQRGYHLAAAVLLAFAASFKFYPLIFTIPFIVRRDTRFLLFAAAACATFLFIVPGLLLGVGNTLDFYGGLLAEYRDFGWVVTNYNSQYFPHVVLRLANTMGSAALAYLPVLVWIGYGIAAASIGLLFLVQRARLPYANLWSFQLLFLTIPFILKTSWPVDLVFLSFSQVLLAWRLLEGDGLTPGSKTGENWFCQFVRRMRIQPTRTALAICLLLLSIAISNIVFFNIIGDHFRFGYYGFLFWSNLLLLMATYVEILPPALRRMGATPDAASTAVC